MVGRLIEEKQNVKTKNSFQEKFQALIQMKDPNSAAQAKAVRHITTINDFIR